MLKAALRCIARLLPFMAALTASVAIGASTPAPAGRIGSLGEAPSHSEAFQESIATRTVDPLSNALVLDATLLARAEMIDTLPAAYPVGSLDTALTAPVRAAAPDASHPLFHLPRPDRWTALFATLALVAFFFLRRIV